MRPRRLLHGLFPYGLGLLCLAGCGEGRTSRGPGGGTSDSATGSASATPAALPDDGPWSDDPAGVAWDACAWIPRDVAADFWVFEPAAVRDDRAPWSLSRVWHAAVEVRRVWVRELGLPEDSLGAVIAVEDPFRVFICSIKGPGQVVVAALSAKGLVAEALDGDGTRYVGAPGEDPRAALVGDRVIVGIRSTKDLDSIVAVRLGKSPSLREAPGLRAVCAGSPKGMPVQVEAGKALRRRRPSDPPSPLATVDVVSPADRSTVVQTMVFDSTAKRDVTRGFFERMWANRPVGLAGDVIRIGVRDERMRITMEGARRVQPRDARRADGELLTSLAHALDRWKARKGKGAYPSAKPGLAQLLEDPELLDDVMGRVPTDGWGRSFVYEPAHPKKPEGFVLRSLGQDGELDTEDDVFPASD